MYVNVRIYILVVYYNGVFFKKASLAPCMIKKKYYFDYKQIVLLIRKIKKEIYRRSRPTVRYAIPY